MERHDDNLTTADLADTTRDEGEDRDAHLERDDDDRSAEVTGSGDDRTDPGDADRTTDPAATGDVDRVQDEDERSADAGDTVGSPSAEQTSADGGDEETPLLPEEQAAEFRSRWEALQTDFVDEPRRSVENGDALVAELMQRLAQSFSDERQALEAQWDRGDDVSTEDLRVALQRYRSFFDRLLSA
jgi:hypothetical protein